MNNDVRHYQIRIKLVTGREAHIDVSNVGGPVSALMTFMGREDVRQEVDINNIVSINILDKANNSLVALGDQQMAYLQ